MAKRISFWATKVKKVPVRVNFRTSDGEKVSFRATKAIRVPRKENAFALGIFGGISSWFRMVLDIGVKK